MTKAEALAKVETKWWMSATDWEIVDFQLPESLLCMPFVRFHEAVEKVLGRPVYTHEFARPEWLLAELRGERKALDPLDSLTAIIGDKKSTIVLEAQ